MNVSSFLGLINNVGLLLMTALLFDLSIMRWEVGRTRFSQVPLGVCLGGLGIVLMLTPWVYTPGIIFDTRSVLLGVAGLFFGTVPTVIAMVMTAIVRGYIGGAATLVGISVILATGTAGIAWRHYRRGPLPDITWIELYLFGVAIHVIMLLLMLLLPRGLSWGVLQNITLPVLLIYPLGTGLLGMLLANRMRRARTSEALRASEEKYRRLHEAMRDAFVMVDMAGAIREANASFCALLGYSLDELRQLGYRDITPRRWHEAEERIVREQIFAHGFSAVYEKEYRRKDGSVIPVELRSYLMTDQQGQPSGMWAIVRDITERVEKDRLIRDLNQELEARVRERTARLEMTNRELETFSYTVSHDLRAPLRAINGFATIIAGEYGTVLDGQGIGYLRKIGDNAERMGQLIDDLLALSRVNRQAIAAVPVRLEELFSSVFQELKAPCPARDVSLRMDALPPAHGDPSLLRQVAMNLLANAMKFTRDRSPAVIEVSGGVREGETVYTVRDNGVGFDPAFTGKLFQAFQRLHATGAFEGTGIGLAIVKRIVEKHGGRVWAEGSPGQGAAFHFTLGLSSAPVR